MKKIFFSLVALFCFVTTSFAATYNWKNVQIGGGGFMPGIIFNETEPDLIYARSDIGGAYRWNATTNSWKPITESIATGDNWTYLGIDSLATDPVDPDRVYLLAGMYTNSWTSLNAAILRSSDRGEHWEKADLPFKAGGNMPGRSMGERLAIDPNDNSIIYLGTRLGEGLWRSTDYGASWSEVASFPTGGTYEMDPEYEYTQGYIGIVWVVFDKSTGTNGNATQTIYVGVADKGDCIYRSTDGGTSWEAVAGQPTGLLPHHGILASNGMLYISYSDTCGPYDGAKGAVYKYDTNDDTWTDISPLPLEDDENRSGLAGLAVDAQNPETIMVATMNLWWPDEQIYRSTDGGATWKAIWEWAGYPERTLHYNHDISDVPWLDWGKQTVMPDVYPKLGWMIGDLEIDPHNSDRMMYVTGATIYGSLDLTNWDSDENITLQPMIIGIEETAVLDLICPPGGATLISGLGDIGGFRHDDLTKIPDSLFTTPTFGNCSDLDYAGNTPDFIVRVGSADDTSAIGFTYDGGTSWFQGTNIAEEAEAGSVAAAADASLVVWAPNSEGAAVSYSSDNGNSWTACQGIPNQATVYADKVNPLIFYGFSNGTFYLSTDKGKTFAEAATELPTSARFKSVPSVEGDIWLAGYDGGLWHSSDSGASFEQVSSVTSAVTIGFGKAAPGKEYVALYISGEVNGTKGIFRSDNAGATWIRIDDDEHRYDGITQAITGDLATYGRVYIGTNGRGILYADTAGELETYTLTVSGGTGSGTYTEAEAVTISWTAPEVSEGEKAVFTGWSGDTSYLADPESSTTTVTMPAMDIAVDATYTIVEIETFNLTVTGGSGSGAYEEGEQVTISWTAPEVGEGEKAVFTGWNGDTSYLEDLASSTTTVTMPAMDIAVDATYTIVEIETFNLTVTGGSGSGSYEEGEQVAISWIAPEVGEGERAVFTGWSGDTGYLEDETNPETTLTMPAENIEVQANYIIEEISEEIKVSLTMNEWNSGATVNITIYNETESAIDGWELSVTFPSGQTIDQSWSSSFEQTGSDVTFSNTSWNNYIAPGANTSFGFNLSYQGENEMPTECTINGIKASIEIK